MSESGAPYTVALTVQRTLVVEVAEADSVEAAVASAVLKVRAWKFPETMFPTLRQGDALYEITYMDGIRREAPDSDQ
jgi:hypothetical protein